MSDRIVIMTPPPGRIEQIIPVEMDWTRDRSSPNFLSLRSNILQAIHFAGRSLDRSGELIRSLFAPPLHRQTVTSANVRR